jgi:hypothetical protein
MKEMIYSPKRLKQPERLAEGEYRGLTYYVLTLGTHPCAYVDVTGTPLDGKGYDDIDILCHFGLTYAEPHLSTVDTGGWFIGWDYGHYTDFAGYTMEMAPGMQTGKKWTTEEMVEECKNVIDQIIDKGFANRKQTLGEWISVEDRLPETYGDVICYTECGYVSQLVYNPQYNLFNVSADNVECAIAVTHWMPLPEPPKMKGGE